MQICPIAPEHLKELAQLYQELLPNEISIAKMRAVLIRNQDNPNHLALVAMYRSKVVGSLLACVCEMYFGQCRPFMVVEDLVVKQEYRGQGIGTGLMQSAEAYARKLNCSYVMLLTDGDRDEAQRLYRSLGNADENYRGFKKHL